MATATGNKPIYRMSSAGKCSRALSAEKLGYEPEAPPVWLEVAANEGSWHEQRIVDKLIYVADRQKEITLHYPDFTLVGHIDGIYCPEFKDNHSQLLEIKSMSQFEFDRWMKDRFEAFPNYAAQLACYMEATGLEEALYIVKNRSSGYEDRQVVAKQPTSINDIIIKLQEVTWARELYPVDFDPNSIECKRCGYKQLCIPEPKELSFVEEVELETAVQLWRRGRVQTEQGQLLIDEARKVLEQHTKATGIDKWKFSGLAINLLHIHKKSYPKKALLEYFTKEHLKPVLEIQDYDQLRIDDLEKES